MFGRRYIGLIQSLRCICELPCSPLTYADFFDRIENVAGTSVGSIFALIFSLDMNIEFMKAIVHESSSRNRFLRHPDIGMAIHQFGIDAGKGFREIIADILTEGGLSPKATLRDLYKFTRKKIVIVATDVLEGKPVHLCAGMYPSMLITDAIYASCALPYIYVPLSFDGMLLVDGSITENTATAFNEEPATCLHCKLSNPLIPQILQVPKNVIDYATCLMNAITTTQNLPQKTDTTAAAGGGHVLYCRGSTDSSDEVAFSLSGCEDENETVIIFHDAFLTSFDILLSNRLYKSVTAICLFIALEQGDNYSLLNNLLRTLAQTKPKLPALKQVTNKSHNR